MLGRVSGHNNVYGVFVCIHGEKKERKSSKIHGVNFVQYLLYTGLLFQWQQYQIHSFNFSTRLPFKCSTFVLPSRRVCEQWNRWGVVSQIVSFSSPLLLCLFMFHTQQLTLDSAVDRLTEKQFCTIKMIEKNYMKDEFWWFFSSIHTGEGEDDKREEIWKFLKAEKSKQFGCCVTEGLRCFLSVYCSINPIQDWYMAFIHVISLNLHTRSIFCPSPRFAHNTTFHIFRSNSSKVIIILLFACLKSLLIFIHDTWELKRVEKSRIMVSRSLRLNEIKSNESEQPD